MSPKEEKPPLPGPATNGAQTPVDDLATGFYSGLRSVLAGNPGPLTGPGTTSWLVGTGEVTVIDPGPALADHQAAILAALRPGERIAAILVTHPHLDHSALCPALSRATGAPVYGFGPPGSGRSALMRGLEAAGITGGEGLDSGFAPDIRVADGEILRIGNEEFQAFHTPGHCAEHLGFGWRGRLFCGDQVMAWAPSLVSLPDGDMGAYMRSLERISGQGWDALLPAHGEVILDPAQRIEALIAHRRAREAQILAALSASPMGVDDLLPVIYAQTDRGLWRAARRNLLAHMADLIARNLVGSENWPDPAPRITVR